MLILCLSLITLETKKKKLRNLRARVDTQLEDEGLDEDLRAAFLSQTSTESALSYANTERDVILNFLSILLPPIILICLRFFVRFILLTS